ncbi:MAG TPA: TIGR03936 family radical SAM-associated protein [Armatimonadota bacterium]
MQRIVYRYRKETPADTLSQSDLRAAFLQAITLAALPVGEGRRGVLMGPSLPTGATSDAEQAVIELLTPCEPSEVCRALNLHLPAGVRIERAWIARPGKTDENPASLDESVYDVLWHNAPDSDLFTERVQQFLAASEVCFTRIRVKKTQQLNARAFVHRVELLAYREGVARVRMTISVGPQGTIHPGELLDVLGFSPQSGGIQIHRVALQRAAWRHPSPPRGGRRT